MNCRNDVITLLTIQMEPNEYCQPEENEVDRMEMWANVTSIKRNEFYAADRNGVKLALCATINVDDYEMAGNGNLKPNVAEVKGKRYTIYRTYQSNDTEMELILQEVE